MSHQLIHIPSLLTPEELTAIESLVGKAHFVDGKITASLAAKAVKNNLQVDAGDQEILGQVQSIIAKALSESPLFQAAAFPKHVYPFLVSKYGPGKYYGWHVDSPVMGDPPMRTDLAMTVFLSDPGAYEGGELVLQTGGGMSNFKLPKGDAILYPCQYLHCVNEVRRGERLAAVTWVQSCVRQPDQRQLLYNITQVHALLHQRDMHSPEANLLLQTYSNLYRMWAEI